MINPYITEYPADPKFFAGRKEELNVLKKALNDTIYSKPPTPHNIATIGDWGVGKTSLLNKFITIATDLKCSTCKITLTPEKCKDMNSLVYNTIDEIHNSLWKSGDVPAKIKEKVSEWKVDSLKILGIEIKREEKVRPTPSTILKNRLIELWEKVKENVSAIAIAYDDLHYLASSYPDGLYDIRGVFQELREYRCRFMLLITASLDVFSRIRGISEPLMRFFDYLELRPFTIDETTDAINLPLREKGIDVEFNDDVIRVIQEKTGGHPYFVMFFAHDLFEYKQKGKITREFFTSVYDKIFSHLSAARFIKDIAIASEKEKMVLRKMATKDIIEVKELKKISNVGVHLKRLEEKNLTIKLSKGRYTLYHPLFREYLNRSGFR